MSAAKHTPGPWRAIDPNSSAFTEEWTCHEDTHAHSVWQPIVDARCKAVALAVDANSDFGDRASFDADARLIAAAPELLEALIAIRDASLSGKSLSAAEAAAWDKGWAAIAKATGSAS